MDQNARTLSYKEAAALVPCDPRQIAKAVEAGQIPVVDFGGRKRIPRAAFERYLDTGTAAV